MKRVLSANVAMMAAVILGCAAHAGARDDAKVIMPDDPNAMKARASRGFSDAIVVGDTIYVSGVVASQNDGDADLKTANAGPGSGEEQIRAGAAPGLDGGTGRATDPGQRHH